MFFQIIFFQTMIQKNSHFKTMSASTLCGRIFTVFFTFEGFYFSALLCLISEVKIDDSEGEDEATEEVDNQDIYGSQDYSQHTWENSMDSDEVSQKNFLTSNSFFSFTVTIIAYINVSFIHSFIHSLIHIIH